MKKVEDIADVTGDNADIVDISNIAEVIDDVINGVNPIPILNDNNFANTTGISDPDSSTNAESGVNDKKQNGWIVTSAQCDNSDKCDKVKQTIVGSIDDIKEVTNGTVQFGTVQTTDRNWHNTHPI